MRNNIPDTIASHRARIELRKLLIDKLEENRIASGYTQLMYCKTIGMCKQSYHKLINNHGPGVTLDSLVLYLHRVGIEVTITTKERDGVQIWPDTEDRIDIIGSNGGDGAHYGVIDEKPEACTGHADSQRLCGIQAGQLGAVVNRKPWDRIPQHGHDGRVYGPISPDCATE